MKKKLNVFLSLLLVVQMILSLAVMPAYAEEAGGGNRDGGRFLSIFVLAHHRSSLR